MMILTVDVGNTNIVMGVFDGDKLVVNWRISTHHHRTADEYGMLLNNLFSHVQIDLHRIDGTIISSVVPSAVLPLEKMAHKYLHLKPLIIGPGIRTGMNIHYDNPREVGADRIVNGVAAYERYGGPLIVVDFGTATTFDVISAKGDYMGGVIAPGIGIATEALFQRAAKLPRVEMIKPRQVIGKNTISSMQSGIFYGFVGQVDGIINRIKQEVGQEILVVATGGLAELIYGESQQIEKINLLLTLEGLRIIYERNRE